jgi:hypothetical protein
MKKYSTLNNLLGWAVFLIASTVYILTSEPTMSYWDCGEYIATAYKLEVGHPPGAPLFQMLGRFFSLFAFGDVKHVARMVNTMSALASGFTILFLFWTITMIAKRIVLNAGKELTQARTWMIMGAGLVGSLAYTFTDSFWFSAVEGEVYGMSSFFTAVVFWAIFKWDEQADERHSYRWLVLIAYLVGLSIGVHLLNLLAIPAITLVYYFRKYPDHTWKGIIVALIASFLILASVMYVVIPWIVKLAGLFELFFVNSLGMPFNMGTLIYFIILVGLIVWGTIYTRKKAKPVLNTLLLAFTFILIGYTSFLMLTIRSNAETPLDENNPENAMDLLAYLNREQYGDWPLLYGPYYNAPVIDRKDGSPVYTKDVKAGKYVVTDTKEQEIPVFDSRFMTLFPRMWNTVDKKYADDYKKWAKVKGVPITLSNQDKPETINKPTFGENLRFFFNYQVIHMYWRYFMWNFAGRQNDNQGLGDKLEGNWKCGIRFLDQARLGNPNIPEIKKSKADNSFYLLPFFLGLVGLYYTLRKDYRKFIVIFLLFIMTGLAIVIYLNQYSPQPRERDYAYAGSFYAFAVWIGLGVIPLAEWLGKYLNAKVSALLVTFICVLLVPVIMAQQGWNDHDRSGRYTSTATAKNYLSSCAPDAILFTDGDNDTFPLWYVQEVEGFRTDVRVVNLSLLNAGWCIEQLKRKAYDSDPVPFSLRPEKCRNGSHDVTYFFDNDQFKNVYIDLKDLFNILNTDDTKLRMNTQEYGTLDIFPGRKFMVTYDPDLVRKGNYIPSRYYPRLDTVRWEIKRRAIEKANLMILDLLATNNWKRPVYFASTMGPDAFIGLEQYFHLEGMAYRLLPVKARANEGETGEVDAETMYDNVMNKFIWNGFNEPQVYLDEQNQRMVMNFRNMFSVLANALIREGKKDSARRVLDRCLEVMPEKTSPFNFFIVPIIEGYYKIGDKEKADELSKRVLFLMDQDLAWLFTFPQSDLNAMMFSFQEPLSILDRLREITQANASHDFAAKVDKDFRNYYNRFVSEVYRE